MSVPVWLIVLVVAPWALYLACGVLLLLGMHTLIGVSTVLYPARHLGPWFDYVVATSVLAGLVGLAAVLT